jgi:hypothetical protein
MPPLQDEVGISDLLLVDAGTRPSDLEGALDAVRGSAHVTPAELVGLFWEMYGLDSVANSQVSMSLRLWEGETGTLRRFGQLLGIIADAGSSEIRWEETVPAEARVTRSIDVMVPDLPEGRHRLELAMETAGGKRAVAQIELIVGPTPVPVELVGEMTRRPLLGRLLCGSYKASVEVGLEENAQISRGFLESQIQAEMWADTWRNPPVVTPSTHSCFEWVRIQPQYFGHGPEPW